MRFIFDALGMAGMIFAYLCIPVVTSIILMDILIALIKILGVSYGWAWLVTFMWFVSSVLGTVYVAVERITRP